MKIDIKLINSGNCKQYMQMVEDYLVEDNRIKELMSWLEDEELSEVREEIRRAYKPGEYNTELFTRAKRAYLEKSCIYSDPKKMAESVEYGLERLKFQYSNGDIGTFYRNVDIIRESFDQSNGLVAVAGDKLVGYMVWDGGFHDGVCTISIVETNPEFRGQGVFNKMQKALMERYRDISILVVHPIPDAIDVYEKSGSWFSHYDENGREFFYNPIRPAAAMQDALSDGLVVAVFPKRERSVQDVPDKNSAKYFQIDVNLARYLREPVVVPYRKDWSVGLYYNKKLLAEGSAKEVFHKYCSNNLLIINKLDSPSHSLLKRQGFFGVRSKRPALDGSEYDQPYKSVCLDGGV